ncbi:hypothetical protein ABZS71_06615 [Streptomyces sp. NPDC005393]|uniref:hypothetical protein n=1 Tax=Streptomyces sp. NPDC005393 TaxID=3157041 RepID=UPI0033B8A598
MDAAVIRRARIQLAQTCRADVEQDLDAFDRLPIADRDRRQHMRAELRRASRRYRYADGLPSFAVSGPMHLAVYICLAVCAAVFVVRAVGEPWLDLGLHLLLFTAGLVAVGAVIWPVLAVLPRYARSRGAATVVVIGTVGVPVASLFFTATGSIDVGHKGHLRSVIWGWDAGCLALLTLSAFSALEVAYQTYRINRRCWPYDGLTLRTVRAVARIAEGREQWWSEPAVRRSCRELEGIAFHAETALARSGSVPRRSPLAYEMKDEALRVAEAFRAHQRHLATARSAEDIDRIVGSLVCAVEALLAGDRAALLANAPERAPRVSLLRRVWPRIWPAASLVAAGIVLPMLPQVSGSPGAESLRIILIVTGLWKLVSTEDAGQVSGLLEKVLPWK